VLTLRTSFEIKHEIREEGHQHVIEMHYEGNLPDVLEENEAIQGKQMNTKQYDLAVAYRIYPGVSKTPVVFRDNKYKLSELCLKSFRASLGDLKVKVWVLLDNCPQEYQELFKRQFEAQDLELILLKKTGNFGTFNMQLDILLSQDVSEAVYFAEDDYYYLPGQFPQMVQFLKAHNDAHFVTPYDHADYYTLDLHNHHNFIRAFGNRHWRTANSTCLTFLTTKSVLRKTEKVFRTYAKNNFDASIWLSLTKYKLFNPITFVKFVFRDILLFKILVKAWLYCWKHILFARRWKLWVPLPSIATAVDSSILAPSYDWQSLIMNDAKEIDKAKKA
jgi:hypothetical protein